MVGACSTYGTKKRFAQGFYCGDLMERGNLEEQRVDGNIILKCIVKK